MDIQKLIDDLTEIKKQYGNEVELWVYNDYEESVAKMSNTFEVKKRKDANYYTKDDNFIKMVGSPDDNVVVYLLTLKLW